ncbi:hypothetical protein RV02_GL003448 [Enterococcus gilvus]|nr:hypothetical protein RV02_GL003448 [Enterococcus gilvus]
MKRKFSISFHVIYERLQAGCEVLVSIEKKFRKINISN